ncbi:MAG: hypothetical protein F4227_07105 [Gammaproteobacteria bacterium]|nr:hypothetical protein [Gammaproteobacteria bacterium]
MESIVRNHGFADGNKRTAVILVGILTKRSGYSINASNEAVSACMLGVASGMIAFKDLVVWFNRVLQEQQVIERLSDGRSVEIRGPGDASKSVASVNVLVPMRPLATTIAMGKLVFGM